MAFTPISGTTPQYSKNADGTAASGFYLKFFAAGTTDPISMATDSTGGTLLAEAQLNTEGYPRTVAGDDATFIPYIDQTYKIGLFPTLQDATDVTNARWLPDNVPQVALASDIVAPITNTNLNFLTVADMVASTTLVVGDFISVEDYATGNESGVLFFKVVAAATGSDDGGSFIDLPNSTAQAKQNFPAAKFVKMWGAVGNNIADDTIPIQAACDFIPVNVWLNTGIYRTTQTITMTQIGQKMEGEGVRNDCQIKADHTNGPNLQILARNCTVRNIYLTATETRRAALESSDNFGLAIGGIVGGLTLTTTLIEKVFVNGQPSHGVYFGSSGINTIIRQVISTDNDGHGIMIDDGTAIGDPTPSRSGAVKIEHCFVTDNGGNGLHMSVVGSSSFRYTIDNLEAFDNAWNAVGIPGLNDAQLHFRGQNIEVILGAFGDPGYANTTKGNGDLRIAKSGPGVGIKVASSSDTIEIRNNRWVDVSQGVNTDGSIGGLRIINNYSTGTPLDVAYKVGANCTGVVVEQGNLNDIVEVLDSDSFAHVLIGDQRGLVHPSSAAGVYFFLNSVDNFEISSGTVSCSADNINLTGEGDVQDSVSTFTHTGGQRMLDGWNITVINQNGYNITLNHGTDNIFTKLGVNLVLGTNDTAQFLSLGTNMYEV